MIPSQHCRIRHPTYIVTVVGLRHYRTTSEVLVCFSFQSLLPAPYTGGGFVLNAGDGSHEDDQSQDPSRAFIH